MSGFRRYLRTVLFKQTSSNLTTFQISKFTNHDAKLISEKSKCTPHMCLLFGKI